MIWVACPLESYRIRELHEFATKSVSRYNKTEVRRFWVYSIDVLPTIPKVRTDGKTPDVDRRGRNYWSRLMSCWVWFNPETFWLWYHIYWINALANYSKSSNCWKGLGYIFIFNRVDEFLQNSVQLRLTFLRISIMWIKWPSRKFSKDPNPP
jgi:hypothetical protein